MNVGEEALGSFRLRIREELFRGTLFGNFAFVEEDDTIGNVPSKGELMGNHDHGHAMCGKILHDLEDLADHLGIESRRRLIEEHDVGIHDKRPGDGDPLLLTAGERSWHMANEVGHSDLGKGIDGSGLGLSLASLENLHLGIHAVLEDIHVVEQVELLEDHSHVGANLVDVDLPVEKVSSLEEDFPGIRSFQKIETSEKRGFSATRGTDDGNHVSLADIHGDAFENGKIIVALVQVLDLEKDFLVITHGLFLLVLGQAPRFFFPCGAFQEP